MARLRTVKGPFAKYIAHSARNSLADFERPLLAPQPTDLHFKHRSGRLQIAIFPIQASKRESKHLFFNRENELQTQPRYTLFVNSKKSPAEGRSHVEK